MQGCSRNISVLNNTIMTRRAGCVIYHEGEFLLLHHPASGYWGFPKGRLKKDEKPELGAIRELYEEAGFKIAAEQLGRSYRCKDSKYYVVNLSARPTVNIDNREIDGFMWVRLDGVKDLDTSAVTKLVVSKIRREGL